MACYVNPQRLLLEDQLLLRRPLVHLRVAIGAILTSVAPPSTQAIKGIDLIALLPLLVRLSRFHGVVQDRYHPGARNAGRIKGAAFDEIFDHPPVYRAQAGETADMDKRFKHAPPF